MFYAERLEEAYSVFKEAIEKFSDDWRMFIREGDPLDNSLTLEEKFAIAVHSILKRYKEQAR